MAGMADEDLSDKVALVTGGGRGIGRATCVALAERGADVAFSFRREAEEAAHTVAAIEASGRRALAIQADMGVAEQVTAMVEQARRELGPITLLVNNAAYTHLLRPDDLTPARWHRFIATNVDAPYLTTWAVLPDMRAAGGGAIVNVSSLSSMSPSPEMVGYSTSKGALNSFGRACARAFADDHIRVNTVLPGLILTPRAETVDAETLRGFTANIPMRRGGTPEEVADMVVFLLSARASYITGEEFVVAGGVR
jgi:NAD(P)-dependent dehydrogenase (short-subunit alcohol dehydrogenase family)